MQEQRSSIWGWAIATGILVFVVMWWFVGEHSWISVLLGVIAAVLVWLLSMWFAPKAVAATTKPVSTMAPVAMPAKVETPAAIAPVAMSQEIAEDVDDDTETDLGVAQPLMSSPPKTAVRAAPKRASAARTASKPRSGDTRTEPRAKATPKAAPKAAAVPVTSDDLKVIKGIGPKIEKALHDLGVTSFAQIAKWTKKDIASFDEAIAGPTRIESDDWIGQAKLLAKAPKKAKP